MGIATRNPIGVYSDEHGGYYIPTWQYVHDTMVDIAKIEEFCPMHRTIADLLLAGF